MVLGLVYVVLSHQFGIGLVVLVVSIGIPPTILAMNPDSSKAKPVNKRANP